MTLSSEARRYVRACVKRIHPDLFGSHEYERQINAESLKILNGYVDQLAQGQVPRPARIEFYLKDDGDELKRVLAELNGKA